MKCCRQVWFGLIICFLSLCDCLDPVEEVPAYKYGASSATEQEGQQMRLVPPWMPEAGFKRLDTDSDGAPSAAEYVAERQTPEA